jgi:hypothetical protein
MASVIEAEEEASPGANIFSFCIYGSNPKYVEGMVKNLEQIRHYYPTFQTWIVVGNDVPSEYIEKYQSFPNVKLTHYPLTGGRLTTFRFFPIDNQYVACMIVRDADSRITERDRECIRRFLESDFTVYTIRDHYYHKCPLMSGQWGIKRISTHPSFQLEAGYNELKDKLSSVDYYGNDEYYTRHYIFPMYGEHMIAFSSIDYSTGGKETIAEITPPQKDKWDFCGNVYEFRRREDNTLEEYPSFEYKS